MSGRFALLLQDFAAQRHSSVGNELRSLSQRFDNSATTWKKVAADPGWEGVSARAASTQFTSHSQKITTNRDLLLRAANAVESFNGLIDSARDAYEALPSATIGQSLIDQFVGGASIIVQGVGTITNVQDLYAGLQTLASTREKAAEVAVGRIQASVEALSADLSTTSSAMVVSYSPVGAAKDKRRSLDEILSEYQVRDDPDGMVAWKPSGLSKLIADMLGITIGDFNVTASEARLLDRLGPLDHKKFKDFYDRAFDEGINPFPMPAGADGLQGQDNHTDAFRHAYWNALLAREFGGEWTRNYTNAHEGIPENPGPREAMDLYNNEVGRQVASEHPLASDDELAKYVEQAVRDGRTVVVAPDGKSLAWSDRVPEGGAGVAQDAKPLPGKNADEPKNGSGY